MMGRLEEQESPYANEGIDRPCILPFRCRIVLRVRQLPEHSTSLLTYHAYDSLTLRAHNGQRNFSVRDRVL